MQCKDIPDLPILEFLVSLNGDWGTWYVWKNEIPEESVVRAMPSGVTVPEKLILAKMKTLIRRGLVSGCGCGCRGDFEITEAGRRFIAASACGNNVDGRK